MKRIIAALLSVLLVAVPALAEVDYTTMPTDELIVMQTQIVGELMRRGSLKSVEVPQGEYIVGVDIPEGVYTLTTNGYGANIIVSDGTFHTIWQGEKVGRIVLKNNQTVKISSGSIIFSVYTGLGF